jgi:hypothetical protein
MSNKRGDQGGNHGLAAMALIFNNIFAGRRVGAGEE